MNLLRNLWTLLILLGPPASSSMQVFFQPTFLKCSSCAKYITILKVSSRHWWESTFSLQGSTFNLFRSYPLKASHSSGLLDYYYASTAVGTTCVQECPLNSCEAGQHCRLVRGTPVCGVVGILRQGDEAHQHEEGKQGDKHLDGWWANYLLHRPKQSNKRTNAKKDNSGAPIPLVCCEYPLPCNCWGYPLESNANQIPKQRDPSKCPPSSCAPGLRCRMVGGAPVCFVASPLTIGLRKTSAK